ncbi:hypothetical protein AMECASPLE_034362 [Ameca splendens]|uniref:Uncharacterized protein n=1 Tax=Ameca splendens TaxID=208324 RepID=A0ABV0YUS3_9TELE
MCCWVWDHVPVDNTVWVKLQLSAQIVTFYSKILWYKEKFIVNPMASFFVKQVRIIIPTPPCLTVALRCLCRYASWFSPTWCDATLPSKLYLNMYIIQTEACRG